MTTLHQTYIKYKNKYLDFKKNNHILKGGLLNIDQAFRDITSFGFEFEFSDIMPFIGTVNHDTKSLLLEPFGYNENSHDDRQNRSVKKFKLPDINVGNLAGEGLLTQDSYDVFNSDDAALIGLTYMDIMESLTNALDKREDSFILENAAIELDYNKIQFNVNKEEHLIIGDTEFVYTFRKSDENIFNINNCAQFIIDELKQYMSGPISNYIGCINIEYIQDVIHNRETYHHKKTQRFDLFEVKLIKNKNIYVMVQSYIIHNKHNMYDYISCSPQITLGVPIKSVKNVILKLADLELSTNNIYYKTSYCTSHSEFSKHHKILHGINQFAQYLIESSINKLNSEHDGSSKVKLLRDNFDIVVNYLFFYYSYVNVFSMTNYQFKETILEIHKYERVYLPRQHFYEILDMTPQLSQCISIIYEINFDIVFSYRIQYFQWIISKSPNIFTFNDDITPLKFPCDFYDSDNSDIVTELHNYIREHFPNQKEENLLFINDLLYHDMKMFTGIKNNLTDNITTFTTRIPYNGNSVLFEYRFLRAKIVNFLEAFGKINNFNNTLTLNNIEFVLNTYKSDFLFSNAPKEISQYYITLKQNNEQTHIKNSTDFLKNINNNMYKYALP